MRVGRQRIEADLDIVKIINNQRDTKIMLRNSIMDDKAKFLVRHTQKRVIELDDSSSSELAMVSEVAKKSDKDSPMLIQDTMVATPVKRKSAPNQALHTAVTQQSAHRSMMDIEISSVTASKMNG
mmetsp:Transcript_2223/g.3358  ORF Transcript_2223/g.3358 Transcript_2223/m.3358 type:complete len:125 (-) Transcript_2223:310-684(-)|eukprot:CAMPEP_0170497898 /NCGR_PEP_ID=MMETSP0208-20121228/26177_1 /TAXON_ID=197538 /ORGANISM="Strombidium inclinatum, Strain S3" /LENGTH=124 /DNA_ID=CAMNT_0010774867 /DNA_START=1277 /DNA_END=1651 /DNA_ORIENTATION=-